jgi:hypothetical protein
LIAIVTVGLEHGKAMTQEDPGKRYRLASVFSAGTTIFVFIAYAIGMSNS